MNDVWGVLIVAAVIAAFGVLSWVFKRWPEVRRVLDVDVDDALTVRDDFDGHADQAVALVNDCRARQPDYGFDVAENMDTLADRLRFEQMLHPSSGNGLCDLDTRWPK